MRGLFLCCLVALATCESVRYDLSLNPNKTYEYKYEGQMRFGLGVPNLAESAVRMTCQLIIRGVSEDTFSLQVSNVKFEEFNGYPGKADFVASPKLTQLLLIQFAKPFLFKYAGGHVSTIQASSGVSDTVVNIVRGILSLFHATIKLTQTIYELEEVGIHGKCQSSYATEMDGEAKELRVTRVLDVNNCREKVAMYTGMATAVPDTASKQKGESVISTVRDLYSIKPTADGGLIDRVRGVERQFFSPFNVKGGNFKMEAVKELVLVKVSDVQKLLTVEPMENKGDLKFKFAAGATFPIIMEDLNDPMSKAIKLIKQLAEENKHDIRSTTTEDNIKLYQLLRAMPDKELEEMWKQLAGNREQRDWFLDTVTEVNDARILRFLKSRFQAGDVSVAEAVQAILLSVNHLQPTSELVEMAKVFLGLPFTNCNIYLWQTVMLSYGSLVYRNCAYQTLCPINTVQPLLNIAKESLTKRNETEMVTALKALGNAGHPGSIKTIMLFLPGVAASSVELSPAVVSAAVQSLRLIATRDPHSVRGITLNLFLQDTLPAEVRMLAFIILFETKPSMALVSTVTSRLLEEKDPNVISSAYHYLRSLARSATPENHFLSSTCNIAVKILAPKFAHLNYQNSNAMRMDWFNDNFLIGSAAEVFMLRNERNVFPSEIIMKSKLFFIGRIMQLLEFGVRADGIKELFRSAIPETFSFTDFKAVLDRFKNWEALPNNKNAFTAYSRFSGQEWFFLNIDKDIIQKVVQAMRASAGKESPLWGVIHSLQERMSWHRVKPFLTFEMRFFQATSLGLPLEISKYYQSVTALTVNAKAAVNPPMTESLGQLLNSQVSLESDGFIGFTKDLWLFFGINTELFQCGSELKSKIPVSISFNFNAKINIKDKKFEIDFPLSKEEFDIASLSSNVYAVNRNIVDPAKVTPLIPDKVTTATEVEDKQTLEANSWHSSSKFCAGSSIYGLSLCANSEIQREYYHEEYPLYYLLGFTHMEIKAVPVATEKNVEKIHLEFDADPSKVQTSTRQLLETLRSLSKEVKGSSSSIEQGLDSSPFDLPTVAAPKPLFTFKALAMSGSQRPEGYEASFSSRMEAGIPNSQLTVSQVGESTTWRMCMKSTIPISPLNMKANIRWGAECQTYEMSVSAEAAHLPGSKPAMKASLNWGNIPECMAEFGRRVGSYIPGMAFLLGFSQKDERNPEREVSASMVATSSDSIDMKITFPQLTVSRHTVPFPLLPASFPQPLLAYSNASLTSL